MPSWLLIAFCVISWGVWAIVEKQATRYASPLMILLIVSYTYSALAPVIFLYMKSANIHTEWNARGIGWTVLGCLLAATTTLAVTTAIQRL